MPHGFKQRPSLGRILDWEPDGDTPRFMPISHHPDQVVAVTRGYGDGQKPEDFLDSFTAFVRDNINKIAALKLVVAASARSDPRRTEGACASRWTCGLFGGQSPPRLVGCEERGHCRLHHRLCASGRFRRSADAL